MSFLSQNNGDSGVGGRRGVLPLQRVPRDRPPAPGEGQDAHLDAAGKMKTTNPLKNSFPYSFSVIQHL